MKRMKKIVSLGLSLVMLLTGTVLPCVTAFAASAVPEVIPGDRVEIIEDVGKLPDNVLQTDTPEIAPEETGQTDKAPSTAETPVPDAANGDDSAKPEDTGPVPEEAGKQDTVVPEAADQVPEADSAQGDAAKDPPGEGSEMPSPEKEPSEKENPKEEKPQFESLTLSAPETVIAASIGETVTFKVERTRPDVAVKFQWQKIRSKPVGEIVTEALYDYQDGPTFYSFPWEGVSETEYITQYPEATWPGIEMYCAVREALKEAGLPSDSVKIAWRTRNFALEGYTISAEQKTDGSIVVTAEKGEERYFADLNENGEWQFSETSSGPAEYGWEDIAGASEAEYSFVAEKKDYEYSYRCQVEVVDEAYKAEAIRILADVGVEVPNPDAPQYLYGPSMTVEDPHKEENSFPYPVTLFANNAAVGNPALSEDVQWITGLTSSYQYITKDSYDRLNEWVRNGGNADRANMCWTDLNTFGTAPVLDENGLPTDKNRNYYYQQLTDGDKLEVNSEWYGKTVYFRLKGSAWTETGTAIDIPAFTHLELDENGNYVEAASGQKYKEAISILNPYVLDVGSIYKTFALNARVVDNNGWLKEANGKKGNSHISFYPVECESFNRDPQFFLMDAEGNYRFDAVAWGVCCYEEPDLSGKAYWAMKDYLSNGYGMIVGHDTMYTYAGSYMDAYGTEFDESSIDPNDGTTWYYDVNSYLPTATTYTRDPKNKLNKTPAGTSTTRGGHFYMNQLMGSNKGNVYDGKTVPSDAASMILSGGGMHGRYNKAEMLFGGDSLTVVQKPASHAQAKANPKLRTPTNYPFNISEGPGGVAGADRNTTLTHTNYQVAFGPIWVKYETTRKPLEFDVGGMHGTNNFYLSGTGNFLMNQVGHLPQNTTKPSEARLFINSLFYVSQRKQCEICASGQGGEPTAHFTRRINSANAKEVLTILQNGGNFWYPLDGCYMLTEDIDLEALFGESWKGIANFSGHWNSDVYNVKLPASGTPLLVNTKGTLGQYDKGTANGWNLGTEKSKGYEKVRKTSDPAVRTTGVARVVGDMNQLFGTESVNYSGYIVKILGKDNPDFMGPREEYSCIVNSDSKYVISNLPCVYELSSGILKARVYKPDGSEITDYGKVFANVEKDFWDNDMTTPLYLGSFKADPVDDYITYESGQTIFYGQTVSSDLCEVVRWEYSPDDGKTWKEIPASWNAEMKNKQFMAGELYGASSTLILPKTNPAWNGYLFRAIFANTGANNEWNTYRYWARGSKASATAFAGGTRYDIAEQGKHGKLTVKLWPAYAEQGMDVSICEGEDATLRAYANALDDGTPISVKWQFTTGSLDGQGNPEWIDVDTSDVFGHIQSVTTQKPVAETRNEVNFALKEVAPDNDLEVFKQNAPFHGVETELTIRKADLRHDGIRFRAAFTAESAFGTKYQWYSDIADDLNGAWDNAAGTIGDYEKQPVENQANRLKVGPPSIAVETIESKNFPEGSIYQDLGTPDPYGQTVYLETAVDTIANGTASYRARIYYRPERFPDKFKPEAKWQYMTYKDKIANDWNTATANALGYNTVTVNVTNSEPVRTTYKGESGWKMYESTMTISGVPASMYNPENLLKYYFRCVASTTYETANETKTLSATDKWGGLTVDYKIYIKHNGVLEYEQTNNINGTHVTDGAGIASATQGRQSSTWRFDSLKVKAPAGHHINTAAISLGTGAHPNDKIIVDTAALSGLGITVEKKEPQNILLVSTQANTVSLEQWNTALRNYVSFETWKTADFSTENILNNTTGGTEINWMVDEARLAGCYIDPALGKAYKLVEFGQATSWEIAQQKGTEFDPELNMTGKLAEPMTEAENNAVKIAAKGQNVWLGGKKSGNGFVWNSTNSPVGYLPWKDAPDKGNEHLYMTANGKWNSGPVNKTITVDKQYGPQDTSAANAKGYKPTFSTTSEIWFPTPITRITGVRHNSHNPEIPNGTDGFVWVQAHRKGGGWEDVNPFGWPAWIGDNTPFDLQIGFPCDAIRGYAIANATAYQDDVWFRLTGVVGYGTTTTTVKENPVHAAVIEYNPQSLTLKVTDHSATDDAVIGTSVNAPVKPSKIAVRIEGNEKVYDGQQIAPSRFEVVGTNADRSLFDITYEAKVPGNHAGYTPKTVNGAQYMNTGAVNATVYHATVSLTAEARSKGYTLDEANSQMECDLIIKQRPVEVGSVDNDKVYDKNPTGMIRNIKFLPGNTPNKGVVGSDKVMLNTTNVSGVYRKDNLPVKDAGGPYEMLRDKRTELFIQHNAESDPHYNYYLAGERYSGSITPRGVQVHSLYLEEPDAPRNVKSYDGTTTAKIDRIVVDGILNGDTVTLKDEVLAGQYSTKNAGEILANATKTIEERKTLLTETKITADAPAALIGKDAGNYFIESEKYTGAIYRETLEVRGDLWTGVYGQGMKEEVKAATNAPYTSDNSNPDPKSWIDIYGLKGSDEIHMGTLMASGKVQITTEGLDKAQVLPDTNVGSYPYHVTGLTEANCPILNNYVVDEEYSSLNVTPREIVVQAHDADKIFGTENPNFYASFYIREVDGSLLSAGSDLSKAYTDIHFCTGDTAASALYVKMPGREEYTALTMVNGVSNIGYDTAVDKNTPPVYANDPADTGRHSCAFCEGFYGTADGTDHEKLNGYALNINRNPDTGRTLHVIPVENGLGETVENYTLSYLPGVIKVHPRIRYDLKASVPMYVCMYGYRGTGDVVTPTTYGITNYTSNLDIRVTDIDVAMRGWNIVSGEKSLSELNAGEMQMKMRDTQLMNGKNKPKDPDNWIIDKAKDPANGIGSYLDIPMTCQMAGGNVNDEGCKFVTKVEYTVEPIFPEKPVGTLPAPTEPLPPAPGPDPMI